MSEGSSIQASDEVDPPGVRTGVNDGSAYDLLLCRTLQYDTILRQLDTRLIFREVDLEAVAGIRQVVTQFVQANPAFRVVEPRFMEIKQAVAIRKHRAGATITFLMDLVEVLKTNGFIRDALDRSGQDATIPESAQSTP